MEEKNFTIEPATLLYDLLHNWWVILLGTITAAMLSCVVAGAVYEPEYSVTTTYVVSAGPNADEWSNLRYGNEAAETFANIIKSDVVKKIACEKLGREEVDTLVQTKIPEGTNILLLRVTDKTPHGAVDIMNQLMELYEKVSGNIMTNASFDVLTAPQMPLEADNPLNEKVTAVKGAVLGFLLMVLLIGLLSSLKDSIRHESDIEEKLDAKSMGAIPFKRKESGLKGFFFKKKSALLVSSPLVGVAFAEAYKKLAARVDYQMTKEKGQILVVTSVMENEGKSTVAANLAITLAEQSKKVLLIDADLRRPSQFLIFNINPSDKEDFGEFLRKGQTEDILRKTNIDNLYIACGKNAYTSSSEILRSKRFAGFLNQCRNYMDYIIIDSPPAGLCGDAEMIADDSDAVLLVTKQHEMQTEDINDVLDGFREHHSKVLGVVLNAERKLSEGSSYGNYSHYGNYGKNRSK